MRTMHLERSQVPPAILGAYAGKNLRVTVTESVSIPMDAGLWSGGTREVYRAVRLTDGAAVPMANHNAAPWDASRTTREFKLVPGVCVVESGFFCGKDAGLHFFVHPDNAAALLPAPAPDLTEPATIVLSCIAGLKSFARADAYRRNGLTDAQVIEAKAELTVNGLIDSRGAVTVKGRNARTSNRYF